MRLAALLIPLLLAEIPGGTQAAALAAHHAIYKLSLDPSKTQNVTEAHGTMIFDVLDTCSAWTTSQHLVIDMVNSDGQETHMVSDYATVESKDGTRLDFHTRQMTDQTVTEQLDGRAMLDHSGGSGHADYTNPEKTSVALPQGTLLPMAHTAALLEAAEAGKRFLSVPLFDGTGADGAQDSFVTVENWNKPGPQKWPGLSALPFGRVHIAFFDRTATAELPDYEITMTYFANGVADGLKMNFGDFMMDGALQSLELRTPHC